MVTKVSGFLKGLQIIFPLALGQDMPIGRVGYFILDSVSIPARDIPTVKTYRHVEIFLDKDRAGDHATRKIISEVPLTGDCRFLM